MNSSLNFVWAENHVVHRMRRVGLLVITIAIGIMVSLLLNL